MDFELALTARRHQRALKVVSDENLDILNLINGGLKILATKLLHIDLSDRDPVAKSIEFGWM